MLIREGLNALPEPHTTSASICTFLKKTWRVETLSQFPMQILKQWLLFEPCQHGVRVRMCVCVCMHAYMCISHKYIIPVVK